MRLLLSVLLHILAAGMAITIARRRADYRPVAALLVGTALANLALFGFILGGAPTSVPAEPLTGMARLAGHTRQALYLLWPFGLVATFLVVFLKRRPWPVAAAYGVFLATLVFGYPTIRGDLLRQAYLAAEIASVLLSLGILIQWGWRRESPTLVHLAAMMLLFGEAGVLYGAWQGDIFGAGWDMGPVMYSTVYAVLCAVQGVVLWRHGAQSS